MLKKYLKLKKKYLKLNNIEGGNKKIELLSNNNSHQCKTIYINKEYFITMKYSLFGLC